MAELIIDLSGKTGLGDGFSGDVDMVTPRPELRIDDGTGFAAGIFNPYIRSGYLSPTTTTSVSYTTDNTPNSQFLSVEYDYINEDIYFADNFKSIFVADSTLTDTSLARSGTLDYTNLGYSSLYDLNIYQINGTRKLFYVGKGVPMNQTVPITLANQTSVDQYACAMISVNPASTTKPTVVSTGRVADATNGTTLTLSSFTVSSATNRTLIVIVYNQGTYSPTGVTFNGVSMTAGRSEGYTSAEPGYTIYTLINPTATTANIVATWATGPAYRCMHAILVDNSHQTTPTTQDGAVVVTTSSSGAIQTSLSPGNVNQLTLASYYSDTSCASSKPIYITATHYLESWSYGEDFLATIDMNNVLLVGYSSIPSPTFTAYTTTFITYTNVPGGFVQRLENDIAFMRNADNGFSYVFAGNEVHKIDGTPTGGSRGTVTRDVLLFPSTFVITDAVDYRSNFYIAVHQYPVVSQTTGLSNYTGKVGLYVWNRVSTQLSSSDYIELPGVREIKKIYASPDGVLKLITISDNGTTELREFGYNDSGGVVFPVKKRLGIGAFPQVPDGLSIAGDKVVWIANDGNMYAEKGNAITKLYQIKAPGTGTTGLAQNITTGALLYGSGVETAGDSFRTNKQGISFSYLDGSTVYTKKIYPFDITTGSNGAQTPLQGDVYTQVKLMPQGSKVRNVRIYNAPTSGSDSTVIATVKLYFNQSTTASMPTGMTKSITKAEAKRGYVDFHINKAYIHAIQIEIEWATGTSIGDDMYMPSVAVVTYDELPTQSPDNG